MRSRRLVPPWLRSAPNQSPAWRAPTKSGAGAPAGSGRAYARSGQGGDGDGGAGGECRRECRGGGAQDRQAAEDGGERRLGRGVDEQRDDDAALGSDG